MRERAKSKRIPGKTDGLPLKDIRIADFSWVAAGPWATALMAQMGAEVIRVESRRKLDICRNQPAFADDVPGINRSYFFNIFNASKKSCTLDLSKPRAAEIAKKLVKISDIVIENFAVGVMEDFGLGYDELSKVKPDLIMVSISGLGQTGPLKNAVCWGNNLHAYSGLTGLTGYTDGQPRQMGGTWADPLTAVTATFAILAALHHRDETGEGQHIDISQCEATMAQLPEALMDYAMNDRVRRPTGNMDEAMAPHGLYRCKGEDKWIAIAVSNQAEWEALCDVLGNPNWTKEERFSYELGRWQNQDELDRFIEAWTKEHEHYEVMNLLQKAGVPAGPCLDAEELYKDRHLQARSHFIEIEHPEVGKRPSVAVPWHISGVPSPDYFHAPTLGEYNEYVFHELLGLPRERIAKLIEEKVIY